ncbi:GNAT family N-acetyltransferase [Paenibacillus oralis]|uniref:GNAT family N-acetyltransferase n=1 Tax=Paenibacillus oralis TaxID=2490856 RepID=A0A3P3TA92_9BACL|nr:GNAT family N-acetyltransferase [Paenibacillus oralis]RRJ54966.1 GNAT family N-acetyltransferase [Paenibacillus oralis]
MLIETSLESVGDRSLHFGALSSKEAKQLTEKMPLWKNLLGRDVYERFHFFAPLDFQWSEVTLAQQTFLMAFDEGNLVGVMLLVQDDRNPYHYGISYVDVHAQHRRKGIATYLYRQLNQWVQPNFLMSTSDLTQEGKKAKLDQIFKREIQRCSVI